MPATRVVSHDGPVCAATMSMVISCSVYRLGDGLLLCQSHDSDRKRSAEAGDHERRVFAHIRQQHLAGSLGRHTALSGEGEASFFVLSDGLVCYLALSPRDAYKDAVMSCLEEVRKSFHVCKQLWHEKEKPPKYTRTHAHTLAGSLLAPRDQQLRSALCADQL